MLKLIDALIKTFPHANGSPRVEIKCFKQAKLTLDDAVVDNYLERMPQPKLIDSLIRY